VPRAKANANEKRAALRELIAKLKSLDDLAIVGARTLLLMQGELLYADEELRREAQSLRQKYSYPHDYVYDVEQAWEGCAPDYPELRDAYRETLATNKRFIKAIELLAEPGTDMERFRKAMEVITGTEQALKTLEAGIDEEAKPLLGEKS
jgi:hypothetical protein